MSILLLCEYSKYQYQLPNNTGLLSISQNYLKKPQTTSFNLTHIILNTLVSPI